MFRLCFFFTISFINSVCLHGQTLTLLPYRQEDCETNCTHGLVSDIDTIVFKAELDYSQDLGFKYLYFQRKTTNAIDFIFLQDIVVNGSVIDPHSWEPMGEHIVKITIRVKATKLSSGARIRGVLLSSKYKEIISEEQIFPEIRDSTDVKSRLLINGAEMTTNMCVAHATGSDIIIIFECDSQVLPCLIEMSATDLMVPLLGKGYVIHTSRRPELNITIKYASCTLDGQVNTIKCSINLDSNTRTEEMQMYMVVKVLSGLLFVMAVVIVLLIFLLFRKRACPNLVMESGCMDRFHRKGSNIHIDDTAHLQPNQSTDFLSVTHFEDEPDERRETALVPLIRNGVNHIGASEENREDREDLIVLTEAPACPENDRCEIMEEKADEADDHSPLTNQCMTNGAYINDPSDEKEALNLQDKAKLGLRMGSNASTPLSANWSLPKTKLFQVDEDGEDKDDTQTKEENVQTNKCGNLEGEAKELHDFRTPRNMRNYAYINDTHDEQEAPNRPVPFNGIGRPRRASLQHNNPEEVLQQLQLQQLNIQMRNMSR